MYLTHLINLREGERERKRGEEKEEKKKEKKRRRREDEGNKVYIYSEGVTFSMPPSLLSL